MADAFLAKVVSGSGKAWIVTPQITEDDGTLHPDITVGSQEGITPMAGDTVLVLTMKNNLNEKPIPRFFMASESNGVIVGVVTTSSGFTLTGDFHFVGDILIDGAFSITGNMTITGDVDITGDVTIDGSIKVGGVDIGPDHQHLSGSFSNSGGSVVGTSGAVVP